MNKKAFICKANKGFFYLSYLINLRYRAEKNYSGGFQ